MERGNGRSRRGFQRDWGFGAAGSFLAGGRTHMGSSGRV
jgi:hypothetical protein